MPDTRLQGTEKNAFAAGGLRFDVVEPMQKWKLSYNGKMRLFFYRILLNIVSSVVL